MDELHERSIEQDVLLSRIRRRLSEQPGLKVVLMGATMDVGFFEAYFSSFQVAQVVVDSGRHAVQDYFLNDLSLSGFWACPSKVIHEVVAQFQKLTQFRSVLVFLATKAEIRKCAAALSDTLTSLDGPIEVRQLYSGVARSVEKDICQLLRDSNARLIVLATNVAEAAVTLENLDAVIDFGHENTRFRGGMKVVRESRASSVQRRGRAGRTGLRHGFYLLMLSKSDYATLHEYREPAVCRLPLTSLIVVALSSGQLERCADAESFLRNLPTVPPLEHLRTDLAFLEALHLTADGYLTNLGQRVSEMQVEPEIAVILLAGALLGVGKSCAFIAAAAMSERLLEILTQSRKKLQCLKSSWGIDEPCCDLRLLTHAMQDYQHWDARLVAWGDFDTLWEDVADMQLMVQPLLTDDDENGSSITRPCR